MEITFDPQKNLSNKEKHGVYLSDAAYLDWDTVISFPDTRYGYGEQREIGYGYMNGRLYCVVFVDRDEERRIISFRKTNDREQKRYAGDY